MLEESLEARAPPTELAAAPLAEVSSDADDELEDEEEHAVRNDEVNKAQTKTRDKKFIEKSLHRKMVDRNFHIFEGNLPNVKILDFRILRQFFERLNGST